MENTEKQLYKKACEIKLNSKIPQEPEIVDRILEAYEKSFRDYVSGLKSKPNPMLYVYFLENMETGEERLEDYFEDT